MVQAQLRVIKADGTVEEYLHTKVMGSINNALGQVDQANIDTAEHFAEVVTYYLYHQQNHRRATSGEILSIIKVVLAATGHEEAAAALSERHFERKLKRSRIEVVFADIQELTDAELLAGAGESVGRCRWDKSRIVRDLIANHDLCRQTARLIAAMVEEKVFNMGVTLVSSSLVKQLVLGDAVTVLRAQRQLQTV
ncbi:MAG: ATP cone domain-containing protein [Planctomycetota bacterium]